MYGYIYKTTNLKNNKIYIGQKKGEFDPSYFGSGKHLRSSIKKYGKDKFKLEIIVYAENENKINELEQKFIFYYRNLLGIDNIYNIGCGGEGGDTFTYNPNREETRKKLIKSSTGRKFGPPSEQTRKKMRAAKIGMHWPKEIVLRRIESRKNNGRSWNTIESNLKTSRTEVGKIVSEETKQKLKISQQERRTGERLRNKGFCDSEEIRLRKKIAQQQRHRYEKEDKCYYKYKIIE